MSRVRNVSRQLWQDLGREPTIEQTARKARTTVDEARRVLQRKGALIVTVPGHALLWSAEDDYAGHYRRYTRRTLSAALRLAGLEVTRCEYFFAPLVAPVAALRSLPSRLGRRTGGDWEAAAREHGAHGGVTATLMRMLLDREFRKIERGRWPRTGTSVVATARKR